MSDESNSLEAEQAHSASLEEPQPECTALDASAPTVRKIKLSPTKPATPRKRKASK